MANEVYDPNQTSPRRPVARNSTIGWWIGGAAVIVLLLILWGVYGSNHNKADTYGSTNRDTATDTVEGRKAPGGVNRPSNTLPPQNQEPSQDTLRQAPLPPPDQNGQPAQNPQNP